MTGQLFGLFQDRSRDGANVQRFCWIAGFLGEGGEMDYFRW